MIAAAQAVLDFWFLPANHVGHNLYRGEWFRKDAAFDAVIREHFGGHVEAALAGLWHASDDANHRLAQIILLDQFTRNIYRDTPRAFAGDAIALRLAEAMVQDGSDRALPPIRRWFVYLPFEHSEDLVIQERSVALFTELCAGHKDFDGLLDYAVRHRDFIARFGRFPHRNAILGRESTPEEIAFLEQPGSSF